MPSQQMGQPDPDGLYIRNTFVKRLLTTLHPQTLLALSGSSLATLYASMQLMPTNGYPPLLSCRTLSLPTRFPAAQLELLQATKHPGMPEDCLQYATPTPAMLSLLAERVTAQPASQGIQALADALEDEEIVRVVGSNRTACKQLLPCAHARNESKKTCSGLTVLS